MNTPKKQKPSFDAMRLLLSIGTAFFLFVTSFLIYYFSKGYRLDLESKEIRKTGVLTIQSDPSFANLYIDGEEEGKTPKSKTLDIGTFTVSVWKEKYREWKKEVEIKEEKTTPIFPFLILKDIKGNRLWDSKLLVEKHWISKDRNIFVWLTKNEDETFSLYSFKVNTPIWNFNQNPTDILELDSDTFELILAPSGQFALLKAGSYYLIDLQRTNDLETLIPLDIPIEQEYKLTWSMDSRYLILESDLEILSLDTSRNITHSLIEKEESLSYIWTTDEEGFFYLVESLDSEDENTYLYAIKQIKSDGSISKYTIEKAYFQKDERYIEHYRNNGDEYPEFTNSPQSTQSTGKIVSIMVNQFAKGVYISTETSSYWYDMNSKKYRMISPYPSKFMQFTPNHESLLFANGNFIYTFRFERKEGDHTKKLGSKRIETLRKDEITDIMWLSNSTYLAYIKDSKLYISDEDGENEQFIVAPENLLLYSVKQSREYITTLETENSTTFIKQYKIR